MAAFTKQIPYHMSLLLSQCSCALTVPGVVLARGDCILLMDAEIFVNNCILDFYIHKSIPEIGVRTLKESRLFCPSDIEFLAHK